MTPYDKLDVSGVYSAGGPKQCKNWCRQQKFASCTDKQRVCAQHSDAHEIRLNRQKSAVALWCLLCIE